MPPPGDAMPLAIEAACLLDEQCAADEDRPATLDKKASDESAGAAKWSRAACETFVEAHYARVFAWFCGMARDRHLAADLTQESFASFWASLPRTRIRDPRLWLLRIARNNWKNHCRARRKRTDALPEVAAVAGPMPDHRAVASESHDRLTALVLRLPDAYREAVTLRYWLDLSYDEIAKVVGVPAAMVRWRCHRARNLLRKDLSESPDESETRP